MNFPLFALWEEEMALLMSGERGHPIFWWTDPSSFQKNAAGLISRTWQKSGDSGLPCSGIFVFLIPSRKLKDDASLLSTRKPRVERSG